MTYQQLFIFVEGDRDERFHRKVIIPILSQKFDLIKIIQWRQKPKKAMKRILKSIKFADYLFVTDIDDSPCITQKKETLYEFVDKDKTMIVIMEIESCYLAGLDANSSEILEIKNLNNTNDLTKEMFRGLTKNKFDSEIDAMMEILKYFNVETAKTKNNSFKYFLKKYCH